MPQKISNLPNEAKVKDTGTIYYGKPIIWEIADKNHTGYPANSVTLITERILALKCFDGKEPNNSDSNRRSYGNNRYSYANVRKWMNSNAAAGAWYSPQHGQDSPPNSTNTNYNPYESEAGFLAGFSADFKAALMDTTLTVAKNTATDGGGSETVTDKIFLASNTEVGLSNENGIAEGTKLAIFSDNTSRIAKPTAEAVANSNYTNSSFNTNAGWYWWLRSPYASNSYYARYVDAGGSLNNYNAYNGYRGVRPLCNLSSEILVSDTTDADGVYTIMWNQPPTTPDGITPPDIIQGGRNATITWGEATDPEGEFGGYILERAANGGAFGQIYKGTNRAYTDAIAFGWNTVQYRVKAYDGANIESGYTTSALLDVVNSSPPTISGSDSDIGEQAGAFEQTYTVTNPDEGVISKILTVIEQIDGNQKRSFTATTGEENTFEITAAEWMELANGSHTLTIIATDDLEGTATRIITFSKNETEIEFTLSEPLAADAQITKAVMNITRQIPEGAEFSVEVCNNGYDETPTWEDVTNAVAAGIKFFFQNDTKTAEEWGFNVRVKVKRLSATGDCFIQGIGGNFE